MFVAGTVDWSVRSMEDEPYPLFIVWESGPRGGLLGVAGGKDGLAELFIDVVRDYEKDAAKPKGKKAKAVKLLPTFDIYGVNRSRGKVQTLALVGTMTPDDAVEADRYPDVGKGFGETKHHIVVTKAGAKLRRKRDVDSLPWTSR